MKKVLSLVSSKKNMALSVVAFILVMIMVVGGTYSWIEDVSQVIISTKPSSDNNTAQYTGSQIKSTMVIDNNNTEINIHRTTESTPIGSTSVNAETKGYFYESGDMHLSGCYGDGKDFYVPVKSQYGSSQSDIRYRQVTKDDMDVGIVSMSFKVSSPSAPTAFWFKQAPTFTLSDSKGTNTASAANNNLVKYAITVDNKETTVYSSNGHYKTIENNASSATEKTDGSPINRYIYGDNTNNDTRTGVGRGQNGYTLFTVPKGETKEITIKVWLEYNASLTGLDLASMDIRLTSSWAQTRTITFSEQSIYGSAWFNGDGGNLFVYLLDYDVSLSRTIGFTYDSNTRKFTAEIPQVYNGAHILFMRCNTSFGNGNISDLIPEGVSGVQYWNAWDTKLPDTFHDETFTEYTPEFGTWKDPNSIKKVYFNDSWEWGGNSNSMHDKSYAYMWDNTMVSLGGQEGSRNHAWPGEKMYYVTDGSMTGKYVVFYDSNYTHIIFNNNNNFQTSDLTLHDGCIYDLASDQWYALNDLHYATIDTGMKLYGNWENPDGNNWTAKSFYNATGRSDAYATAYLQGNKTYSFIFQDTRNNQVSYRTGENNNSTYTMGNQIYFDSWENGYDKWSGSWTTVDKDNNHNWNINIQTKRTGIYIFRYDFNTNKFAVAYPYQVNQNATATDSASTKVL